MPDPLPLPHQDRPDPAVLLIDAVINRQSDLAQRLSQQLVHRQGLSALDNVLDGQLLSTCGDEGVQWLRQQLSDASWQAQASEAAAPTTAATPRPAVKTLLKNALHEALAPLRQDATPRAPIHKGPSLNQGTEEASSDPWELQPLQPVASPRPEPKAASSSPAPLPVDLADLRAWLHSDAA